MFATRSAVLLHIIPGTPLAVVVEIALGFPQRVVQVQCSLDAVWRADILLRHLNINNHTNTTSSNSGSQPGVAVRRSNGFAHVKKTNFRRISTSK